MTDRKKPTAEKGERKEVVILRILIACGIVMAISAVAQYNSLLQLKYLTGWPTPTDFNNCIVLIVCGVVLTLFASWHLWKRAKR